MKQSHTDYLLNGGFKMKYEVLQTFTKTNDSMIAFSGTFEECIDYCVNKYKHSMPEFPQTLIWSDSDSCCEIFENLEFVN